MKKFFCLSFLISFALGISQEKKISFTKEIIYKLVEKNASLGIVKTYSSDNNEVLTRISIKSYPLQFFTDALGTSPVSLDMNNRLDGSDAASSMMYFGMGSYGDDDVKEFVLESKKLTTKETVAGVSCSHYLINYRLKNGEMQNAEDFKLCIDEKSSYNNLPVLNGLLNFQKRAKYKSSGLKGLILKGGPEKTYDTEYFAATSIKDSKDFVYFDHRKTMTEQQRKRDSIMAEYRKKETEYAAIADSAAAAVDSAAIAVDSAASASYGTYIPDYVSEYKKNHEEGNLAISSIPSDQLWKGLPKHCRNIDNDLPEFKNKEVKSHLKNYVGQMCDMYLTQADNHSVGIKMTLDEIRREVLYLNEIHEKLDASDQKKLNNYLKNLD
ncbi:hypothetical protein [Chryseobacterium vrystaatense]|uniref:Uncharacterized protein n=1 Tax=Chryseobacterium vrystaatense TaxID=307480 RepID=A0A1M4ZQN6_9FLAO|nr:hypothetical protein [Chryseobacterium vrystaatense]KFF27244.1 hypothetical protein IW16_08295 [Chryseobacterium vrystaatense]SHF20117.1 hypothetical protein SAMN02787073_1667 [Chryseobacterium vrystaatense]